jgi:hypothetical protein
VEWRRNKSNGMHARAWPLSHETCRTFERLVELNRVLIIEMATIFRAALSTIVEVKMYLSLF